MKNQRINTEVLVIGAGAAGLMCAIEAGRRGRQVIILEKSNKAGKKILMSGGGRCNFTNYHIDPSKYQSHNPHFCKSALSRFTQWDFISLVESHKIPYYEKTLGQLFCLNKSSDITQMLLSEAEKHSVDIRLNQTIQEIKKTETGFILKTAQGSYCCQSLVVASGGLSIPTLGSSPMGYQIAEQFGLKVYPTRAGLVPFTLHVEDKNRFAELSGVSLDCIVSCHDVQFRENMLFTHRGLSGPAMLQISSYWQPGESLHIKLLPDIDCATYLQEKQQTDPRRLLKSLLAELLAKRLLPALLDDEDLNRRLQQLNRVDIERIANSLQNWQIKPNATEGYRTAEVTLGGVDCDEISSKTFEAHRVPNLYFIGEVLDLTGWLGGYNFQWAWSSGWAAGQVV